MPSSRHRVTEAFGCDQVPCSSYLPRGDALLLLEFCDQNEVNGIGVMILALIRSMEHQYTSAGNNDAGSRAAAVAWAFFAEQPLP